ncbi:MAG: TetR/AcrR family transcriptional regulator [Acidimicrobiia bacterium]
MAAPPTTTELESALRPGAAVRRSPFSENPTVGARGQLTRQRILDAALAVFADVGYHRASIDQIAKRCGCSRVAFYQYFASKNDLFRQLALGVARQVSASTEALDPLLADLEGWSAMRAWVARYDEIHARHEPVFVAYETDQDLAGVAANLGDEAITRIHSRLVAATLPPRQLDPVIRLLLECLNHSFGVAGVLRSAAPTAYPRERVREAITDVVHRTLFGARPDVNQRTTGGASPPALEFSPAMRQMLRQDDDALEPSASQKPALFALLSSGRDVFVTRGYHDTRVDDLVAAAGVSRGVFYRYFRNKGDLARALAARAMRAVGRPLLEIPDVFALDPSTASAGLRKWLRRYNAEHAKEAAMLHVWVDAALADPEIRAEYAAPLDWGRRRMSHYLRPRGFGDVDMDAVVMVALFGVFGARPRSAIEVEAAAHIIERGFLGADPTLEHV